MYCSKCKIDNGFTFGIDLCDSGLGLGLFPFNAMMGYFKLMLSGDSETKEQLKFRNKKYMIN